LYNAAARDSDAKKKTARASERSIVAKTPCQQDSSAISQSKHVPPVNYFIGGIGDRIDGFSSNANVEPPAVMTRDGLPSRGGAAGRLTTMQYEDGTASSMPTIFLGTSDNIDSMDAAALRHRSG